MNMRDQNKNRAFATSDFGLAVFLHAKNVLLFGLEPTNDPRKFIFLFQRIDDLQKLIDGFWSNTEKIEPLKLLNAERELKRLLHSDSYRVSKEEK